MKRTEVAVGQFRRRGINMAMYIDNWLISASYCKWAADHIKLVTEYLVNPRTKAAGNVYKSTVYKLQFLTGLWEPLV